MMLTALALAAASIVAPPITMSMRAPEGIPADIVATARAEAAAIWRTAGLEIAWSGEGAVRVSIDAPAAAAGDPVKVVGYVVFTDGVPAPDIHLSYDNALVLLNETEGVSHVAAMTQFERNLLLGRALGRALAHELGHYLFSSRTHTTTGLMQAHRRTTDFFKRGREGFEISAPQRSALASKLSRASASR